MLLNPCKSVAKKVEPMAGIEPTRPSVGYFTLGFAALLPLFLVTIKLLV